MHAYGGSRLRPVLYSEISLRSFEQLEEYVVNEKDCKGIAMENKFATGQLVVFFVYDGASCR
jgi:hypothetical protein